jgi:hypothetical protein
MKLLLKASILVLLLSSSFSLAQEPVPILSAKWQRTTRQAPDPEITGVGPVTPVMAETKYFQRKAREQRTDNPLDPDETSIEGRSRAMDKAVRESRAPKADDLIGYLYSTEMRNDTGQTVHVIFWEYQFTEIARPTNVVRRQFLCGAKLKNGEKKEMTAFSLLGPSDVIDVESLAKSTGKLFEEKVQVNRIELADGTILQRDNWKFSDVKDSVARVTSTPWGKEPCKAL